jgi:hypothetical protein
MTTIATNLFVWGFVAHMVADWFLQNEWMALKKTSLKHPAAWVHSGIHLIALLFVFPPLVAVVLAVSHILIDTRVPLQWWRKFYRQTTDGPAFIPFAMWQDQAAHILCLAVAAWWAR